MYLTDETIASLKLDLFRAILLSHGQAPSPGVAAGAANSVFDELYGTKKKAGTPRRAKK